LIDAVFYDGDFGGELEGNLEGKKVESNSVHAN
jgi:hypothetical protein